MTLHSDSSMMPAADTQTLEAALARAGAALDQALSRLEIATAAFDWRGAAGGQIEGALTVAQLAEKLGTGTGWIYDRINREHDPLPALNDGPVRIFPGPFLEWAIRQQKHGTESGEPLPENVARFIPVRRKKRTSA